MLHVSRNSSPSPSPPIDGGEVWDPPYIPMPYDSQTDILAEGGSGDEDSADSPSPPRSATAAAVPTTTTLFEIDFERTPVHRLPNEILMYIFGKFDQPKDLYTCMLVCSRWARHSVDLLWHRPACNTVSNLSVICQVLNQKYPFFSYRQFVRRLNLSHLGHRVNDGSIVPLAVCSRLERLTLANCSSISDSGLVRMVTNTPALLALDVSNARNITDTSIDAIATNCRKLQGLNITNCTNVASESLANLARSCRFIKRLKLNGCHQVTNEAVTAFAENCPNILEIDLFGCVAVSNAPITALMTHSQALRELRLANCDLIDDDAFLNIPANRTFGHLRILDLTNCVSITDAAVERIIDAAPRLRNLVLNKCRQLTDHGVVAISRLGKNLHYLHLGHCNNITDEGLTKLVLECNRIRYIDLACCTHLTDESVTLLASLPKLKRIGLVKCLKITDACVKALARRKSRDQYMTVSSLERVHLSYCTALNLESIYILLNSCPKLTHLSLTGVQPFQHEKFAKFCRPPPAEFNQHQREMFCVFSGHGVAQFRDCLNSDPEFDFLKASWVQHQRAQLAAWGLEPWVEPPLYRFRPYGRRPYAERSGLVTVRIGPHIMHASPIRATPHPPPPATLTPVPNDHVAASMAMPMNGLTYSQVLQQPAQPPLDSDVLLQMWNAQNPIHQPQMTMEHRIAREEELAGIDNLDPIMGNMNNLPGIRRPRARTAPGMVRWPGADLPGLEGLNYGNEAGPSNTGGAGQGEGQDDNEEQAGDEEDHDLRGGAHL